jgi:hypothetical protein
MAVAKNRSASFCGRSPACVGAGGGSSGRAAEDEDAAESIFCSFEREKGWLEIVLRLLSLYRGYALPVPELSSPKNPFNIF